LVQSVNTNGEGEISIKFVATPKQPGVFIEWVMGSLGKAMTLIERVREEAGTDAEFALVPQIDIVGHPAVLVGYGAQDFSEAMGNATMPVGTHEFPIASVGPAEEFSSHLRRFDEDCWNIAGQDFRRSAPEFVLEVY
jgi:hypothetical protein